MLGGKRVSNCLGKTTSSTQKEGLKEKELKLVIVDGDTGLLAALRTCFPDTPIQCCTVHKLSNITRHCPKSLKQSVVADATRIIYATSKKEALENTLRFMDFSIHLHHKPHLENIFREFRRWIKVMDTFPTEEFCIRIMFSLVQLTNEGWEDKPFKHFR